MRETTFTDPDLTTLLGLTAVGPLLTAERAVVECRMPAGFEDAFCKACGPQRQARGTVVRACTCRWGGGPHSWWCACGASPARTAAGCGCRTRLGWPNPEPV